MLIFIKIKNLFFSLFKKKKFLISLFIFLGVSLPNFAYAAVITIAGTVLLLKTIGTIVGIGSLIAVGGALTGVHYTERIGWFILILLFRTIAAISMGAATLAAGLLNYVVSPDFTVLSYTNPARNPMIEAGLSVTQGFVNILLILVLIYIALATILRLAGYETQKLLVTFILIALLVNFAPLICGLIVDAANIVMHYFLINITEFTNFSDRLADIWKRFDTESLLWNNIETLKAAFFQSLILSVFGFVLFLVFLLYTIVFIARYVAIWILVIFAPLAFICYILPATKRYFTLWWNQLLQWSFIGVIAGFFLYLASVLIVNLGYIATPVSPDSTLDPAIIGFLPSLVPMVLLFMGLLIGFQTSAAGASAVIGIARRQGRKAGAWMGKKTLRGAEKTLKIPERAEQIGRRLAGAPIVGGLAKPLLSYSKKRRKEEKEELEGFPLKAKARITGKSIQDIIGGLGPREFAEKVHPDDISLDVFRAIKLSQLKRVGERGSPKLKEAIRNVYIKNSKEIMNDYKNLRKAGKVEEARALKNKITHVMRDPNYIT